MPIEIWKQPLRFGSYRQVSSGLNILIYQGSAFASWKYASVAPGNNNKLIPVSDELAAIALGARRHPCPHIGTQPGYSTFGKPEYFCCEHSTDDGCHTYEKCKVCGFSVSYPGNPQYRAVMGSGDYSINGHPTTTYLVPAREHASIAGASWDWTIQQLVAPIDSDDVLVVWVQGNQHLRLKGAYRAMREVFPDAQLLFGTSASGYFLVRDDPCKVDA